MLQTGDTAPAFTAPVANGDVEPVTLSDVLETDPPVVLAFFPGAFTGVCTHEMNAFEARIDELTATGATLFGVSVDLPFAQNEFREQLSLSFGIISDTEKELIDAYDVQMDFADMGVHNIAKRSVFVIDDSNTITYAWASDDPGVEPDYDEVIAAVEDAA